MVSQSDILQRMAVERIHFKGGIEVVSFLPSRAHLETLIETHRDQGELVPPGGYEVTPDAAFKSPYRQYLLVFDRGRGRFRAGGQEMKIEEGSMPVPVMTRNPGSGTIQIHDIVRFVPGT